MRPYQVFSKFTVVLLVFTFFQQLVYPAQIIGQTLTLDKSKFTDIYSFHSPFTDTCLSGICI